MLRHVPWHRLTSVGRGLRTRTAAAVGLLWLAAAGFGVEQAFAPRPAVAATVLASAADARSAFVTAAPVVDPATASPLRNSSREAVTAEVGPSEAGRNRLGVNLEWSFRMADARRKLDHLYPQDPHW